MDYRISLKKIVTFEIEIEISYEKGNKKTIHFHYVV